MTASIGNGARIKINEALAAPESRSIFLFATEKQSRRPAITQEQNLRPSDYLIVRQQVAEISAVSPRVFAPKAKATFAGRLLDAKIEGVGEQGFSTLSRRLLSGTLFTGLDIRRASSICVVSMSLARAINPSDALGQSIRVDNVSFSIVGIVDDVVDPSAGLWREDLHLYVPFTSLLRRVDRSAEINIVVQASNIEAVGRVQQRVQDVMEEHREGRKAIFQTTKMLDSIQAYAEGSRTVASFIAAIGVVALVVGGIGIMNIMLAAVTERTREIGVCMAIGMRSQYVLQQFLAEALMLSVFGAAVGVGIGWLGTLVIAEANEWPMSMTLGSVMTAVCCSLVVGGIFGYQPALRAARLRPIEALRSEG